MSWTSSKDFAFSLVILFGLCVLVSSVVTFYHFHLLLSPDTENSLISSANGRAFHTQSTTFMCCTFRNLNGKIIFYNTQITVILLWMVTVFSWIYRMGDLRILPTAGWCNTYILCMTFFWAASDTLEKKRMKLDEMEMELLPLKYTVIVAFTAISTILALLLLAIVNVGFLMVVDAVINQFCLVSMTRNWKSVYWWVCSPLLLCLSNHTSLIDPDHRSHLIRVIDAHSGIEINHSEND